MRDLIEAGFEIAMVRDAIAAGRNEEEMPTKPRWSTSASWPKCGLDHG